MNRAVLLVVVIAALLPFAVAAQTVPTAPTPDPQVYDDPGMHFRAPDGFNLVGRRPIALDELTGDPQFVAGWRMAKPTRAITIQQESYDGDVSGFESVFEQQLRNQYEDALVQHQESMSLRNGMPAEYMELTAGSGFDERKGYIVIWADGTRGVALMLMTQAGDLDSDTAKRLLSDASAVRYPVGRQ
jgi:hypothetical protein